MIRGHELRLVKTTTHISVSFLTVWVDKQRPSVSRALRTLWRAVRGSDDEVFENCMFDDFLKYKFKVVLTAYQ